MNDEDIRSRYRRDFTGEPIGQPRSKQNLPRKIVEIQSSSLQPVQNQPKIEEKLQATPAAGKTKPEHIAAPTIPDFKTNPRIRKKSRPRLKKFIAGLLILGVLVGGSGWAAWHFYKKPPLVPKTVSSSATFPILYPAKLPVGYQVVQSSFNISSGGIVAYYAQDTSGNKLNFTLQPRPANFDFEKFYTQIMSNTTRFNTPLGEAAVGSANGHLLGSLATTKSWVLASGNSDNISADQIQTALSNMTLVQASP